jgi:hypothetical protein
MAVSCVHNLIRRQGQGNTENSTPTGGYSGDGKREKIDISGSKGANYKSITQLSRYSMSLKMGLEVNGSGTCRKKNTGNKSGPSRAF